MTILRPGQRLMPLVALMLMAVVLPIAPGLVGIESLPEASAMPVTVITVDTTEDLADTFNHSKHTCTWTSGAFFFPAGDGECTLRRAVVEAANRPDSDRPILIQFNIPTNDSNYDASLHRLWYQ